MTPEDKAAIELGEALGSLYLVVDSSVADDIRTKVTVVLSHKNEQLSAAESRAQILVEALEFYEQEVKRFYGDGLDDNGERARQALDKWRKD